MILMMVMVVVAIAAAGDLNAVINFSTEKAAS